MHVQSRVIPIVIFFLCAGATALLNPKPSLMASRSTYLNPPPALIERFTFGFTDSVADSLWLRWIQDGDGCQTYGPPAERTLPAVATPTPQWLENPRHRQCDQSWSFKMLDAVTRTAPRFEMPYLAGAMTLSVLVEDYEGASEIFDRGLAEYPDDWKLLYRAGYHFLYDVHDLKKAGDLMNRAADHGAPSWVKLLATRIFTRTGQIALGVQTLENYLRTLDDPKGRAEIQRRIDALKRELPAPRPRGP